jgi:hypothetical protein
MFTILANPGLSLGCESPGMQASSIAAAGIASAAQRLDASAARTAARALDNLAGETVERIQAVVDAKANAAVLRASDEMTGALLDILV